jgi:hypothetical protein|tara:strand:+ start:6077 stop:7714 length:1638 start_codon:yes stop_codon:yes gene_type:complete
MNDHKLYFYLLFIFVACEIKKPSDKTENTILPIIQDTIIQDIRNANTPNIDFTQKMEAFPCFEDETIIKKHTFYFDFDSIYAKDDLNSFQKLIESTYLNYCYLQFMEYITLFNHAFNLKAGNNPKLYFLYALELIDQNNIIEAKKYLEKFLNIQELYSIEKDLFFRHKCDQYDVNWLESPQTTLSYKYAQYIYDLLEDIIIQNDLSLLNLDNIRLEIQSLDPTPEVIDLSENIEFIFTNLLSTDKYEFKKIFYPNKSNFLTSSLNAFEDEKDIYFLTSHLDLLVYAKLFRAKFIYDQFTWDKSFIDALYPRHLKSLLLLYDLERKLFKKENFDLLYKIETVVKQNIVNPYPNENQVLSLVNIYRDIASTKPRLPQSIKYISLVQAINDRQLENILEILVTLEKSYNNEKLNSLDSAMAFVYQMELIDADLLKMIPVVADYEQITISVLPQYADTINIFIEYMLSSNAFSFIMNEDYSPRQEFYYKKVSKKNIGYGFYSLNIINELREMKQKFNPNHPLNIGSNPFYQIFNTYKSIVEGKDRYIGE